MAKVKKVIAKKEEPKKVVIKVVEKETPVEKVPVKVEKVAETKAGAGFLSDVKVVTFEGAEVIAILEQNEKEKLCRMSSGITTWVPNASFQDEKDEN
jgi:uncharacterized ferredoxin-like protein